MGGEQLELVIDTWKKLGRSARHVSEKFYELLLEQNPLLKIAFKVVQPDASEKLTHMLSFAIVNLRRPQETLIPAARQLGRLNAAQGVRPEYYDLALSPLLGALQQTLGAAWNLQVEAAWKEFFYLTTGALKEGATHYHPQESSRAA